MDYAFEAVKRGACTVGVRTSESIILGVEKKTSAKLQDARSMTKIFNIDSHIGMACAGLTADARILANHARWECQSYRLSMDNEPTVTYIAKKLAQLKQRYTQRGGVRPFGVSCLITGFDIAGNPLLYMTEPSGSYSLWKANAIGKSAKTVQEFLEKNHKEEMTHQAGVKLAVQALLEVVESGTKNLEISYMKRGDKMTLIPEEELHDIIADIEAEKQA